MKTFYLTLLLFFLLLALVTANALYVNRTAKDLETRLTVLAPADPAALDDLVRFWEKQRKKLSFSIPSGQIFYFETALCGMKSAAQSGDAADFERNRGQALLAVRGLRRLEQCSTENLF